MKSFTDALITVAVLGGILVASALITGLFTRAMYYKCDRCRALNARRRTHCRLCGNPLQIDEG
jgi:hypothetical protein